MSPSDPDTLLPEAELAVAWSPPKVRAPLTMALLLDRRLVRIVARTTEPMLGQMRMAWWREALAKPVSERPRGDAVLDGLGTSWEGREAALVPMIDAWELLATADRLGPSEIEAFGSGRGAFFKALGDEEGGAKAERIAAAAFCWAIADAAAGVSDPHERALLVAVGVARGAQRGRFPSHLRGLAVLNALAQRSLRHGGQPLMLGRGAPLAALKAAIFLS